MRVLGEFPTSSDDTVCPLGLVELAQRQRVEPGSPLIVSCDPARFGSDETVIAVRQGSRIRIAATYGKKDLMETAGRILRVARAGAAKGDYTPKIVVDDIGIGGGLVDRLREIGEFTVTAFSGAASARDSKEYPNARSQAWFDFAERLGSLDLDDDEQLAADLVAPSYKIDSQGRRVVEPKAETKKRLGRSPDRADAFLMSFAEVRSAWGQGCGYCGAALWSSDGTSEPHRPGCVHGGAVETATTPGGLVFRGRDVGRYIDRVQ